MKILHLMKKDLTPTEAAILEAHRASHEVTVVDLRTDTDYGRIVDIMRKVKYRGFITLEYEAAEDPLTGIPKHLEAIRKVL